MEKENSISGDQNVQLKIEMASSFVYKSLDFIRFNQNSVGIYNFIILSCQRYCHVSAHPTCNGAITGI